MNQIIKFIKEKLGLTGSNLIDKGMTQFTAGLTLMEIGVAQNVTIIDNNKKAISELESANAALAANNEATTTVIRNFETLILSK